MPREADHGTICGQCHARLRAALAQCPDIVAHLLVDCLEPARGEPSGHSGRRFSPPAPLNVTAIAAADDLHAMLYSWVTTVCDEGCLVGPPLEGSRIAAPEWRGDILLPARVVGVKDPASTQTIVVWLLRHTNQISQQSWAHEMVTEITRTVGTLTARWPQEERPVTLPIPCPACGATSLVRHAPEWEGAPTTITCQMVDCQHAVPEDRYDWLIRLHTTAR
jgi:hypothetical protein